MRRAVLLDRDGVLIEDVHLLTRPDQLRLLPGVPAALTRLQRAGFVLAVVSNQPVVARGMASEAEVEAVNDALQELLIRAGAAGIDKFYFCPHHPQAFLAAYRMNCMCRKPRPGMLLQAGQEFSLNLRDSFMIGDRITDIAAGANAGCLTVLVETGRHGEKAIETPEPFDMKIQANHVCNGLPAAADWILNQK